MRSYIIASIYVTRPSYQKFRTHA